MCWAVPAKVVELDGMIVKVDFGGGTIREALAAAPDELAVDDFVLVHAGTVISRLSKKEFMESFRYYRDVAIQMAIDAGVPRKKHRRMLMLPWGA